MNAGALANPFIGCFHGLGKVIVCYDLRRQSRTPTGDDATNGVSGNSWHANEP